MNPANITLRQLRYLVSLADNLHFGRAAAACHVSQPSLSAQIQQLEEMLGATLVERTKHRVLLTPAGDDAVVRARAVLAQVDDLSQAVRASGRPLSGALRLGVIPTSGPYLLPRVLPGLRAAYPELKLYLREDMTDRLLDRLRAGDLDMALLALPVTEPGVEVLPVYTEIFLVAMPRGHRLDNAATVDEGELKEETLLLLEDGHCFRDQALNVCAMTGAQGGDGFAATSLTTLVEMVAGGLGLTLLPALAAASLAGNGQVGLRAFADPAPSRTMALVWRRGSPRAGDIKRLADVIVKHLPDGAVAVR